MFTVTQHGVKGTDPPSCCSRNILHVCKYLLYIYNYSCMACSKMPNHVSGVKMPLVASTSRDFSTTYIANGKF